VNATKWTAGPWHNDSRNYGYGPCDVNGPRLADGSDYAPICTANTEANAQLIAAAPELYAALELVVRDSEAGCLRVDTVEHIKDVLAKARGEEVPMHGASQIKPR
jgi:hypothetical protein